MNALHKRNLAIFKAQLPENYTTTLSKRTGLSRSTVNNYFIGKRVRKANANKILDEALALLDEETKRSQWRLEQGIKLLKQKNQAWDSV